MLSSLGSLVSDAMERGLASHNPLLEMRDKRRKRRTKDTRERRKQLKVGVDIPEPAEIRTIIHATSGYRRALFATAALSGLRASELRGLRWVDVDFTAATITVHQRADAWGSIDVTKTKAGERTVPVPTLVINALREWKLACPRRDTGKKDTNGKPITELHYVFPNGRGKVENQTNIVRHHWFPLQIAAGVSVPALNDSSKSVPLRVPKYPGLHALRHFFCSWCANSTKAGGLGLSLKETQYRMGHPTLAMTADRYGHLFKADEEKQRETLAAGERALMGA